MLRSDSPFYRGCFFLCAGSLTMALGGILNLLDRSGAWNRGGFLHEFLPFSIWTGALILVSIGFLWVANAPDFTRMALLPSILHLLQAANIVLIVVTGGRGLIHPDAMTMGRLASLLVFVYVDRHRLAAFPSLLLGSGALLQIVKINLRVSGSLTDGTDLSLFLDTLLLLWLAAGLFVTGTALLRGELKWELSRNPEEAIGLASFNNPEHPWNRKSERERTG